MRSTLSWMLVAFWLLSLANTAVTQVQALLFDTVVVPVLAFKVLLVGTAFLSLLIYPQRRNRHATLITWLVFVCCILASAASVFSRGALPMQEQAVGLLTIYLYMIAVPLFVLTKPLIRLEQISATICVSFVPLALLGLAQYWFNDPIVSTGTPDGSITITAWNFYGQVRAFSLFAAGLDFAFFLALAAGLFAAFLFDPGSGIVKKTLASLGLFLAALATHATLTRIAYLFVPLTVVFSAFLSRRKMVSRVTWFLMPVTALLLGVAVVIWLPLYLRTMNVYWLSDDSLVERLFYWNQGLDTWLHSGPATFWFGTGVAPGITNPDYIIDNTFLNFAVQSGTLGLCGATLFMFAIWMWFRELIHPNTRPETIAFIAFWATFLLTGMFNVSNMTYALAILPLLNCLKDPCPKGAESKLPKNVTSPAPTQ